MESSIDKTHHIHTDLLSSEAGTDGLSKSIILSRIEEDVPKDQEDYLIVYEAELLENVLEVHTCSIENVEHDVVLAVSMCKDLNEEKQEAFVPKEPHNVVFEVQKEDFPMLHEDASCEVQNDIG